MPQPSQEDFFDRMHEWSDRKLKLLENYVDPAAKILHRFNQIYYVDGFAGRGKYLDGASGSPIRMAELSQKFEREQKPYSFKCINVEENAEYFANLETETAKFGRIVQNIHGRFADNLDRILYLINGQPAIFFLDPFGIKGIEWSAVSKIIWRKAPTDLWIRFDHLYVRRLDGNYEVNEKKFDNLPSLFGIPDESHLHELLSAGETPEERIRDCMELYRKQLEDEFKKTKKGSGYADSYAIKSLAEVDKYYLMFATSHEKGIVLASKVVYGVEKRYQKELQEYNEMLQGGKPEAEQMYLFAEEEPTPEKIFQEKVAHLKTDIVKKCKGRTLTRLNIHTRVLDTWFGRIGETHVTEALKNLKNEGYILEMKGNFSDDRSSFRFKA